jgi:hypothetical protein
MQQPSFDQSEEDPPLTADDLDPAEIGRSEGAGGDSQEPDEEVIPEPEAQKDDDPNTFFRCDNVKP